jgi:hypothetical protein
VCGPDHPDTLHMQHVLARSRGGISDLHKAHIEILRCSRIALGICRRRRRSQRKSASARSSSARRRAISRRSQPPRSRFTATLRGRGYAEYLDGDAATTRQSAG